MKKLLLSLLAGFFVLSGFSQSQRYIIVEEFTNASCAPCAAQNPAFQALMAANTSKCTYITYHWNFPGPNDPMYLANPTENQGRIGYYGFNYVPSCVLDGNAYAGVPANLTQTMINNQYAVPSPFELYINHEISPGNDSIYVTMLGKCTEAVSGQLVAHTVVLEKHIHYNTAPGSNGEKDFYNVMRKMLPNHNGATIPSSFQPGDYFILQQAWKLANITSMSELSVTGFIQNKQTKAAHQAAITSPTPITGVYANDVEVSTLVGMLPTYCVSTLSPTVKIRNNGTEPLTSVMFHYRVNSGEVQNYQWTGNLGFLETATVQLPAFNFQLENSNVLTVYTDGTNAVGDNYTKNDTITHNFNAAIQAGSTVTLNIKTDNYPEETTWVVKDNQGVTIASGGPYTQASHVYSESIPLGFGICYEFTIYDAGGNGVCCSASSGYGYYQLKSGGTTIRTGTDFGAQESTQFYSPSGVGVAENLNPYSFTVYPNPFESRSTLSFTLATPETVEISLISLQGKTVKTLPSTAYGSGQHSVMLDGSDLPAGLYNVQLKAGGKVFNQKITVK